MVSCDCCGKRVDERSMATVADGESAMLSHGPYMVCQACRGMYDDQDLLEKCEHASLESQTKPGNAQKPGVDK